MRIGLLAALVPMLAWLLLRRTQRDVWMRRNVSDLQVEAGDTAQVEVQVGQPRSSDGNAADGGGAARRRSVSTSGSSSIPSPPAGRPRCATRSGPTTEGATRWDRCTCAWPTGAERLLGRGDMLYMAPDLPKLLRLQGCFVSDAEIRNLVNFWRGAAVRQQTTGDGKTGEQDLTINESGRSKSSQPAPTETPWAGIVAEADKDDLLEQAIKLVTESGRASTSFLQRRLGIGYPRASRLMDQLETEGLIGPADGSKAREILWREKRDEADYDEFEADVTGIEGKQKGKP